MDAKEQNNYTQAITKIVRGGDGTGCLATATLDSTGAIRSGTVVTGGYDYSLNDILTVSGGTNGKFKVASVGASGSVTSVVTVSGGTGYSTSSGATTTVSPSGGTGCTIATVVEKEIDSITISSGGSDYLTAIARFNGGGSSNGTWNDGVATVVSGEVIDIAAPDGITYTSVPDIIVISSPPSSVNDLVDAISDYEVASKNDRYKDLLRNVLATEVLTPEQSDIVNQTYDSLFV